MSNANDILRATDNIHNLIYSGFRSDREIIQPDFFFIMNITYMIVQLLLANQNALIDTKEDIAAI